MPHGVDLLRCLERVRSAQNTEESTSCTLSIKIEPDSRGLVPGIHVLLHDNGKVLLPETASKTWMAGTGPAMTKGVVGRSCCAPQQARSASGPSPIISGCCARATAGDIRITSAWAPKIAAAR